jgi:hypothetical protein
MPTFTRRRLLQASLAASLLPQSLPAAEASGLRIAPFRFDVTPPVGHPLCGGWITPVVDCEDELEAIGYILLGAGKPIVVCAVDWTGILNEAHLAWRSALADAAGTTPDRVAVQCVHQHDAPFVCLRGEELAAEQKAGLTLVQLPFFNDCLQRGGEAVKTALLKARPLTHIAHGEGRVEKVASNRRVLKDAAGMVLKMRGSASKDAELVAMPEGLIDPMLKTVAFYDGDEKVLACHYYATHPMSHYGKGNVSSDFVGLARKQRQKEEPGCTHIYFTGASGNIAAGKYNDGSPEARVQLTQRIYEGIIASEKQLAPQPISKVSWQTQDVLPEVNPAFTQESELAALTNPNNRPANRLRPAMRLAWMERIAKGMPITLSALHVNEVSMLHLPAESFLEYQLRAQQMQPGRFVATAAYGDGGAWYIPVKEAFPEGGYEVSVANCAPAMDDLMSAGIRQLLAAT